MVLLIKSPSPWMGWRAHLLGYAPGLVVGLGLVLLLRFTPLDPPTRVFVASLPMWFLFTLASEMAGPRHPWPKRLIRASAYALLVSALLYAVVA
jgi:hypothetical protein